MLTDENSSIDFREVKHQNLRERLAAMTTKWQIQLLKSNYTDQDSNYVLNVRNPTDSLQDENFQKKG